MINLLEQVFSWQNWLKNYFRVIHFQFLQRKSVSFDSFGCKMWQLFDNEIFSFFWFLLSWFLYRIFKFNFERCGTHFTLQILVQLAKWRGWGEHRVSEVDVRLGVSVQYHDRISKEVFIVNQLVLFSRHVNSIVSVPVN